MASPTRWGIVSTGKICKDFVLAVKGLPKDEHKIEAVAASSVGKAKDFAKHHAIPTVASTYDELGDLPFDIGYIGVINTLHFSVAKKLLEKGKHVLCEKPMCTNLRDTQELIDLAKKKKLFLMEAVWSRCFPIYEHLRKIISSGELGEIYQVHVNFGLPIATVPRIALKDLGGGTVLDIGVYAIQFSLLVLGKDPINVAGFGNKSKEGIDENASISLQYPNGKMATLITHSKVALRNSAIVYGTKGSLEVNAPFWCPTSLKVDITSMLGYNDKTSEKLSYEKVEPLPKIEGDFHFINSQGLAYEAQEVRRCLQQGLTESPLVTHDDSIAIAKIQNKVMNDIGVVIPTK